MRDSGNNSPMSKKPEYSAVVRMAEERLRAKLAERPSVARADLLRACGLPEAALRTAESLLVELAGVIGASPERLRAEDHLIDLLAVRHDELPPEAADTLRRKGIDQPLSVFGDDLFFLLQKNAVKKLWTKQWEALNPRPHGDDEWIDTIVAMDLRAFLLFFSKTRSG